MRFGGCGRGNCATCCDPAGIQRMRPEGTVRVQREEWRSPGFKSATPAATAKVILFA